MMIGFTYLQEHDVIIICPVVVQEVDQCFGDIKHLLHSFFLEQIVLTQNDFDQIVPADQRCYLLVVQAQTLVGCFMLHTFRMSCNAQI